MDKIINMLNKLNGKRPLSPHIPREELEELAKTNPILSRTEMSSFLKEYTALEEELSSKMSSFLESDEYLEKGITRELTNKNTIEWAVYQGDFVRAATKLRARYGLGEEERAVYYVDDGDPLLEIRINKVQKEQ